MTRISTVSPSLLMAIHIFLQNNIKKDNKELCRVQYDTIAAPPNEILSIFEAKSCNLRVFYPIFIEKCFLEKLEKKYAPALDNYGQSCFVRSNFLKRSVSVRHK